MWCVLTGAEAAAFAAGLNSLLHKLESTNGKHETTDYRFDRLWYFEKINALHAVANQLLNEAVCGEDNTFILDLTVGVVYQQLQDNILFEILGDKSTVYRQTVVDAVWQVVKRKHCEWRLAHPLDVSCLETVGTTVSKFRNFENQSFKTDYRKWFDLVRVLAGQSQHKDYGRRDIIEKHVWPEQWHTLGDYFTAHIPRLCGCTTEVAIADIYGLIQSVPGIHQLLSTKQPELFHRSSDTSTHSTTGK